MKQILHLNILLVYQLKALHSEITRREISHRKKSEGGREKFKANKKKMLTTCESYILHTTCCCWHLRNITFLPPNSCFEAAGKNQIIIKKGHKTRLTEKQIKLFDTRKGKYKKQRRELSLSSSLFTNQNETFLSSPCSCFGGWKRQFIKKRKEKKARIRKRRKAIACENMFPSFQVCLKAVTARAISAKGREEGAISSKTLLLFHAICIRWHHL